MTTAVVMNGEARKKKPLYAGLLGPESFESQLLTMRDPVPNVQEAIQGLFWKPNLTDRFSPQSFAYIRENVFCRDCLAT